MAATSVPDSCGGIRAAPDRSSSTLATTAVRFIEQGRVVLPVQPASKLRQTGSSPSVWRSATQASGSPRPTAAYLRAIPPSRRVNDPQIRRTGLGLAIAAQLTAVMGEIASAASWVRAARFGGLCLSAGRRGWTPPRSKRCRRLRRLPPCLPAAQARLGHRGQRHEPACAGAMLRKLRHRVDVAANGLAALDAREEPTTSRFSWTACCPK